MLDLLNAVIALVQDQQDALVHILHLIEGLVSSRNFWLR